MRLRWPLMLKRTHDADVKRILEIADQNISREYDRANKDGIARVHAWAQAATSAFFDIDMYQAKGAAIAAFQHAEQAFSPEPKTLSDHLYATTIKEDIHAATRP